MTWIDKGQLQSISKRSGKQLHLLLKPSGKECFTVPIQFSSTGSQKTFPITDWQEFRSVPLQSMCYDDVADSLKMKSWAARQTLFWIFTTTPKGDCGVRPSISRLQYLPTHHDSTSTHNHHHNYSIIHHPLQPTPFFYVISPILATLVKIFP